MTEINQTVNAASGVSLPAPQGLVCFYDDDLPVGKDFVEGDIAKSHDTLPGTGLYSLERVRNFAKKTFFDPSTEGAFDMA
jgi:hypothetical protein